MIQTQGEKIIKLRSDFGLNQWDIVNSEVSRNFISMIENDKSALTPRVAEIIISMLDAHCLSNELTHDYTVAYLLEDVETQVASAAEYYELRKAYLEGYALTLSAFSTQKKKLRTRPTKALS